MDEEKLKKWIEKKLENGIEKERIKDSLENTGHDPSIVEEIKDPFHHAEKKEEEKEETQPEEESDEKDEGNQKEDEESKKENDFELPSIKLPEINLRKKLDKKAVIGIGALLILTTAILGISQIEKDISIGKDYTGCTNQGVMIQEVSTENGKTVADVKVVRNKSKVVLKILRDGEVIDKRFDTFIGEKTMTVGSVGDEAVFHPVGCKRYIWNENY